MREGARETIQNNRKRLCSITEIIVWCGRQTIALCDPCESGTDMEGIQATSTDQGTFVLCSTFVSRLETLSWGNTFRVQLEMPHTHPPPPPPPDIQNQLISILGDHICNAILRKVHSSLGYTLIADEVTDCSNKEQLCIEDLVTFLECDSNITGKALADKMLGFVRNYLDPSKMHGQAYDGASNMSCKTNWAVARIGVVKRLSNLPFAQPKCHKKLEEAIQNTQPESNMLKLKDLCRTRWIEWIGCLDHIKKLYSSIVAYFWEHFSWRFSHVVSLLGDICQYSLAGNNKNRGHQCSCDYQWESTQYFWGLTTSLQEEAKDIFQAVSEIKTLTSSLKQVRENVNSYHSRWFETVSKMCNEIGTIPSTPRICGHQCHWACIPASNSSEYFIRTITVSILDHLHFWAWQAVSFT